MNYRLNEFYMEVLREWINTVDIDCKPQLEDLVKTKLKSQSGSFSLQPQPTTPEATVNHIQPSQSLLEAPSAGDEVFQHGEDESDDEKYFNKAIANRSTRRENPARKEPRVHESEQIEENLQSVSCSSEDVYERIQEEIRLAIYGTMTTPRKNRVNVLQFTLENVLIKTARETFFRSLIVKADVELLETSKLEGYLIKKS